MDSKEEIAFWEEVIEIYRENPCLWNEKCVDYDDESKKNIAYGLLLEKLWEIDENADIDTVNKKIEYLRSRFAKCIEKKNSCKEQGQKFKPTWTYYNSLRFLTPFEDKNETENIETDTDPTTKPINLENTEISSSTETQDKASIIVTKAKDSDKPVLQLIESHIDKPILTEILPEPRGKKRKFSGEDKDDDVEDDCSTFAAYVKTKMRSFDPMQKCIAQKLISDVLFMAETKNLQLTSGITNLSDN